MNYPSPSTPVPFCLFSARWRAYMVPASSNGTEEKTSALFSSFFQKREYCAKTVTLQTAALKGLLWDTGNDNSIYDDAPTDLDFLVPFISLAQAMDMMHKKGWIIRDLKPDTILIDCQTGEARVSFIKFC